MIVFKESPLVLTGGAIDTRDATASYVAIAKRFDLPIQLVAMDAQSVAFTRDAAARSGVRIVVAGVLEPSSTAGDYAQQAAALVSAGVDFLYAPGFASIDGLQNAARAMSETKLPFTLAPALHPVGTLLDGTPLAAAIERLDDDASARPWHYLLDGLPPPHAATALEGLFRAAPAFAHRVVGLKASADDLSPVQFARDVWDIAQTFGLHVLGGSTGTGPAHIEALAERARS